MLSTIYVQIDNPWHKCLYILYNQNRYQNRSIAMFKISKRPTIQEIHALYQTEKATPIQVVQFFYNRIKETNPKLNSFLRLTEDLASQQANNCQDILESGQTFESIIKQYPLFGIPYGIKDIILIEGLEFTSASNILKGYIAPYSSTVYNRINQSMGIVMGINNMDQFAMGSSGESSAYGTTKNPFDLTRTAGGSSSGGAASVASGQVVFSLGSDTGGSIRQPASFCDVVGLKPTYGLVSRWGVMPMASSFDQVGPFTNTVYDNLLVTKVLAGVDTNDQTTIESVDLIEQLEVIIIKQNISHRHSTAVTKSIHPMRIGIPKEFYQPEGVDPAIYESLQDLLLQLKELGHKLIEIDLPLTKYAVAVYYMTMGVEVASNLERVDGIRYAKQEPIYANQFTDHRSKYFGEEAKRRIMIGTYASSAGYYDAFYNQAQKVRELARLDFQKAFQKCDIMLTPTTPEFPFVLGTKTDDPLKMYLSDVFTCGINPVKIPGLTVPMGLLKNTQSELPLPAGCQLLAPELCEDRLYELGLEIEKIIKAKNLAV